MAKRTSDLQPLDNCLVDAEYSELPDLSAARCAMPTDYRIGDAC